MQGKNLERMIRAGLTLFIIVLFIWSYFSGTFQFIFENPDDLFYLLGQHLKMVGLSSLLAVLVAVPLGILITRPRFKKYEWIVNNTVNVGQTVPTLAILALVMSYFGIGFITAVFALWLHSLLPILRNTVAGIESVSHSIIDAGRGMGMTSRQILWKLEMPNSFFAILAGVRTSLVINVGTAALAYLIGGGGLGDLIFTGIYLFDTGIMLSGALPVTLLAVTIDYTLSKVEKIVIPKGLQRNLETL
jgi:osmoprotectant transport system permease protein